MKPSIILQTDELYKGQYNLKNSDTILMYSEDFFFFAYVFIAFLRSYGLKFNKKIYPLLWPQFLSNNMIK